ncbi:MAG: DinB family protein [Gemmatimonadaceae bacterium]
MPMIKRLSALVAFAALGACAQNSPPPTPATTAVAKSNLLAVLDRDVADVEKKMVGLAKAMPENTMDWRPMPGVRSVREVFLHISGENYMVPSFFDVAIPVGTGIVAKDDKTVTAYEARKISRDSTVADLEASFKAIRAAMAEDSVNPPDAKVMFYGGNSTHEAAWIGTVTHMHEHLGQAIAYARSNKVVPPWSK